MGGKSAKQLFQKLTNSASKKCWGKMSEKTVKNVFLYSHEYRDEEMWGQKTHETIFPETNE